MRIDAISDLHGHQPELPGGDLLIIAGDCTASDCYDDWERFFIWLLKMTQYDNVVLVVGNHDGCLAMLPNLYLPMLPRRVTYLEGDPCDVAGLRIYGDPHTPRFDRQNPKAMHFTAEGKYMSEYWQDIPSGLDILVTHGPPLGVLDTVIRPQEPYMDMLVFDHCGDAALQAAVLRAKPRVHVFGHIYGCGGGTKMLGDTRCYNVSCVNEQYQLVRGATRVEI